MPGLIKRMYVKPKNQYLMQDCEGEWNWRWVTMRNTHTTEIHSRIDDGGGHKLRNMSK